MSLAGLTPNVALAALLDGRVEVQTSATDSYAVRCYAQAKQPNKGLADEFLTVQSNGIILSKTKPRGLYEGNLALSLLCKANADNTAKTNRISQMIAQCEMLVDGKGSNGFFFELDANNVITPPTVNPTNGYATTILNVAWHTTNR